MSIAKTFSAQLNGLRTEIITIEVDISHGLHSFSIVGLGDRSIDEAKDRISASIKNSGFISPKQKNEKIIISLGPADIRKEGSSFDLGMTMAYLKASKDIDFDSSNTIFLGELSLDGKINRISGILPILSSLKDHGFTSAIIPRSNSQEARLIDGLDIYPAQDIVEVTRHLTDITKIDRITFDPNISNNTKDRFDIVMVKGNDTAKRGLEIAGAGAHNIALYGPPGTGKTLLAQCFQSILPDLDYNQSIEVTGIHSISNHFHTELITRPPFRAPHHTASYPAIVGGGNIPKPGELTLAHRGILFLDEFPEFEQNVIESLRQPLENREITISRAKGSVTFPAQCILIISMNPCPCGRPQDTGCTCTKASLERYSRKISGPIKDRIDIWINVDKVDYNRLGSKGDLSEDSYTVRNRIIGARSRQKSRFANLNINKSFNSEISSNEIEKAINIEEKARNILIEYGEKLHLSGRTFHRIMKVGRTIADLQGSNTVNTNHILEALQYRPNSSI